MSAKKLINGETQIELQSKSKISELINRISTPYNQSPLEPQYGFRASLLVIEDDLKEFCLCYRIKHRSELNFETLFIGDIDDVQKLVKRFFIRPIDDPEDKLKLIFMI